MSEKMQTDKPRTILDYYRLFWERKWFIVKFVAVCLVLALVVSLIIPNKYKGTTTLVSLSGTQDNLSGFLMQQGFAPMLSNLARGVIGGENDRLMSILLSYTITERVVNRLDLLKVLFKKDWDEEKGEWEDPDDPPTVQQAVEWMQEGIMRIDEDKRGLVRLVIRWYDPEIAALIANTYAEELARFIDENAFTIAKRNLKFLNERLDENKLELEKAEEGLRAFQEEYKIIALDVQTEATMRAISDLQAKVISKNIELGMLNRFTTVDNPKGDLIRSEIKELKRQIAQISLGFTSIGDDEDDEAGKTSPGDDLMVGLDKAPGLALKFLRLKREALIQEKVFEFLTQQTELAKIEESKSEVSFQIVDAAFAAEEPYQPKYLLNLAIAFVVSIFLSIVVVFFQDYLTSLKKEE